MLLVNNPPVPKPCGIDVFCVAVHWAMAFNPILLSNALVIHQPILRASANFIQSSDAEKPPNKLGFKIIYCGCISSSRAVCSVASNTPINSSSKAMGIGVCAHSFCMALTCPAAMGCSIL